MKKVLFLLTGLLFFNSCLSDVKNTSSYTLQAMFDYPLNQYGEQFGIVDNSNPSENNDSLYVTKHLTPESVPAYGWQDLGFFYKLDASSNFKGGFIASYSRDYRPYESINESTVFPKYWSVFENKHYKKPADKETKDDVPAKEEEEILLLPNGFLLYRADADQTNMPEHDIIFINTKYGSCTMSFCLINNTAQNVAVLKNTMKKGDVVKVTAIGTKEGQETGKAEIILAEYNEERNFVMREWTKFDLSPLGDIDFIDFEFETNNASVAPYFCIDMLTAAISLSF